MIVKTYTNMWNEEKKLYAIHELTLPTPIGFRQIGLFMLGAVAWMPLMFLFKVPIYTSWGFVIWFAVPVLLAIFGNQPRFEGKSIFQFATSMISFTFQPKRVLDGEGISTQAEHFLNEKTGIHKPIQYKCKVWSLSPIKKF